jgi:hypothetical protein
LSFSWFDFSARSSSVILTRSAFSRNFVSIRAAIAGGARLQRASGAARRADEVFEQGPVLLQARHDHFQRLLGLFGSPDSNATKRQVMAAITSEQPPFTPEAAASRNARVSIRVALRQMKALNHPSRSLPAWLEAFDRVENDADEDEAAKQHDH